MPRFRVQRCFSDFLTSSGGKMDLFLNININIHSLFITLLGSSFLFILRIKSLGSLVLTTALPGIFLKENFALDCHGKKIHHGCV